MHFTFYAERSLFLINIMMDWVYFISRKHVDGAVVKVLSKINLITGEDVTLDGIICSADIYSYIELTS